MIRQLNRREQRILVVCLGMVFACVFYNSLIIPLQTKADFLHQEIAIRQKRLSQDLRIVQKAEALEEKYAVYLEQFHRAGTREEAISSILSEIEKVAGKLKLHVMDLKPQKIRDDEQNNAFSVSVTINSELVDVVRFLYMLQQQPYSFDVEELQFEKLSGRKRTMLTTRLVLSKAFILTDSDKPDISKKGGSLSL